MSVARQRDAAVALRLPRLAFHLAEASNWPSIRRLGLLSTSRLLALSGVVGEERQRLERAQRPLHTQVAPGVWVRDQRPLPAAALAKCLVGMQPADWYAAVNTRVFFWFDPERLERQRRACEPRPQVVLVLDAHALVRAYRESASLTPINTGNARRKPALRGAATFVPVAAWEASGWQSEAAGLGTRGRPAAHRPVELTVLDAVPDVMRFVLELCPLAAGERFHALAQ